MPIRPANFLRRVLKPAAIRAGIAITKDAKGEETTLKHYQQAIPAEVRAAAIALEAELLEQQRKKQGPLGAEVANARLVWTCFWRCSPRVGPASRRRKSGPPRS